MNERAFGIVKNGVTGFPNAAAEICIFVVVKELSIESSETLKQFTSDQNETTCDPADGPLRVALPSLVFAWVKEIRHARQRSETEGEAPFGTDAGERADTSLIAAIRTENLATKRPCLWMAVGVCDHVVEGSLVHDGVGIKNQNVFPGASLNADVIAFGKPKIPAVLDQPRLWKVLPDVLDRAVRGAVVRDDNLKFCL